MTREDFLGGTMKKFNTLQKYLLGLGTLMGLMATVDSAMASDWGIGLSLNYSNRDSRHGYPHYYGNSMFGYGGAANSWGAINGCFNGGGGGYIGGGGGLVGSRYPRPVMPAPMPRPMPMPMPGPIVGGGFNGGGHMGGGFPPLIPPHAGGGPVFGQVGGGFHGGGGFAPPMPRPMHMQPPGGCQTICGGGFVPAAYGPPPMMGPVAGGPYIQGGGGFHHGGGGGGRMIASANVNSGYSYYGGMGGTTIIDMRSKNAWEVEDTADIMWSTALGLGMTTTNVFPFTGPRNGYTNLNLMYNTGDRDTYLQPRPHAAQ